MSNQPYNPYLQASQGSFPQANGNVQSTPTSAETMLNNIAQSQAISEDVYGQFVRNKIQQSTQDSQARGLSVGSSLSNLLSSSSTPYGLSAQERNRARVLDARQNMAARLNDEEAKQAIIEDNKKIILGADPNQVREERHKYNQFKEKATNEQRMLNYEAYSRNPQSAQEDPDLRRAIEVQTPEEVQAKYSNNPELLNYIMGKKAQRMQEAIKQTTFAQGDSESIFNPANLASAVGTGLGETVGSVADLYNLTTLSGKDRIEALTNSVSGQISDYMADFQSAGGQASDTRAQGDTEHEQRVGMDAYEQARRLGASKDQAGNAMEWAKTKEAFNNLISNPYQITKEIAQFAPDVATSLIGAGVISGGIKAVGKTALEKSIKHFDDNLAEKVRNDAIKQAVLNGAKKEELKQIGDTAVANVKQEFVNKATKEITQRVENQSRLGIGAFESANNAMQNAPSGYETAANNIMNMPLDTLKETQGFKDMKAQNPELSDKDIQIKMADEAGKKGYAYAGGLSALSGAVGSKVEADIVLGRAKGLTKKAWNAGVNSAEEAVQEGGSVVAGNVATNQETKDKTVGTFNNAGKPALMGAVASGATTGAVNAVAGLKKGVELTTTPVLTKVKEKQEDKINKQSSNDLNQFYGSNTNTDDNSEPDIDSESVFKHSYETSSIKKMVDDSSATLKELKIDSKQDIGSIVSNLSKVERQAKKAKDTDTLNKISEVKSKLYDGFISDAGSQSEDFKQSEVLVKDVTDLVQEQDFDSLKQVFQLDKDSSPEDLNNALNDFIVNTEASMQKFSKATDAYNSVKDSPLIKYLEGKTDSAESSKVNAKQVNLFEGMRPIPSAQFANNIAGLQVKVSNKELTKDEATKELASSLQAFTNNFYTKKKLNDKDIQVLKDTFKSSKDLFDTLGLSDTYQDFSDLLNKHDLTSRVNKDIFIGGIDEDGNEQKGLLTYLLNAMQNNGKLSAVGRNHLNQFKLSQVYKNLGVLKAIQELVDNNESEEVNLYNPQLQKEDKRVISRETKKPVVFKTIEQASNYLKQVNSNLPEFNRITDKLLGLGSGKTKETKEVKQETKPEVKPITKTEIVSENKVVENQEDTKDLPTDSNEEKQSEETSVKSEPNTNSVFDLIEEPSDKSTEDLFNIEDPEDNSELDIEEPEVSERKPKTYLRNTLDKSKDETKVVETYPLVRENIVNAFGRISKKWSSRDSNEHTKDDTETNSTTIMAKGKSVNVPRSALIELRRKGLDLFTNLLKATTKTKPNFVQTSIQDFLNGSNNIEVNNAIKDLQQSFGKLISQPASLFKTGNKVNEFYTSNGFLNLYEKGKDGKLSLSGATKTALFKAIVASLTQQSMFAFGKASVYTDYWDSLGDSWTVSNTTENYLYGDKNQSQSIEDFDITTLGQDRSKFISMLGSLAIQQLGLEYDYKSEHYSDVVRDGLEQSIGLALLNVMLQQGLVQEHTVTITGEGNKSHNIPYINFTANLNNPKTITLTRDNTLKETSYNTFKYLKDEEIKGLLPEVEDLRRVTISHKKDVIGSSNELDLENTNTKNRFTKSNSTALKEGIALHNAVKFTVNNRLYNMLKLAPDTVKAMLGFTYNVDKLNVTDATKKSITSRNNQIERSIRYLQLYIDNAELSGIPQEDIIFEFNHRVVPNMRIMMDSTISPQSDKIIREMLNLFQFETNDGGETIEGQLELKETLPKSDKPRSIKDLVYSVTTGKGLNPEFSLSFMLALAQALDIGKLEKITDNKIMEHLSKALTSGEHSEMFQDVLDGLWELQLASENNEDNVELSNKTKKAMMKFGQTFGTNSPRAMNALSTLANFMYLGTDKDPHKDRANRLELDTSLNIESDGISNGGQNITRQFVSSFSTNYLNTLKRTGYVTLDVLSQMFSENINKVSGADLPLEDKIFGSATMFGKESGKDELLDIYEVIAKQSADKANSALRNLIPFLVNNNIDVNTLTLDDLKFAGYQNSKLPKEAVSDLRFLIQMEMTGHLKSSEPLSKLVFEAHKNVGLSEDFLIDVKRNLAKSGVTPKVYGSLVKGVASQLTKDIKDQFRNIADSIIDLSDQYSKAITDEEKEDLKGKINKSFEKIKQYAFVLDTDLSQFTLPNLTKEQSLTTMSKMLNVFGNNSSQIQTSLMGGLANYLNEAVEDTFKEEFGNMQYSIIQDSFDFTNFIAEFKDNVLEAMNQRNKRKGYKSSDPRTADPLTRNEYISILKNIASTPAMATAFVQNAEMLEDVLNLGNSVIKTAYGSRQTQTTLSNVFGTETPNQDFNTISNQIMSKYRDFMAAGASNTTSTIPSTEARTQTLLLRALRRLGKVSLDVFDGVEMPFMFRNLAGKLANKATNEVHLSANLFKAFYDRFKRSGIIDTVLNPQSLGLNNKWMANADYIHDLFDSYEKANYADIKYLMSLTSLAQMYYHNELMYLSKDDTNYDAYKDSYNEVKRLEKVLQKARDELLNSSAKTISIDFKVYRGGRALERINAFAMLDLHKGNVQYQSQQLLNTVMGTFANKVAHNQAIKTVEAKYLPMIVNQFGGGNRGYFFNKERLNDTGRRFVEFVRQNYGDNYLASNDLRLDSTALKEFLEKDSIIQKEYTKVVNNTLNRLNPFVTDTKDTLYFRLQEVDLPYEQTKEFKEEPTNKVQSFFKSLEQSNDISSVSKLFGSIINPNSVKGKWHKVIFDTIQKQAEGVKAMNPDGLKVIVGRENFIDWLQKDLLLEPTSEEYLYRVNMYDKVNFAGYFDASTNGVIVIKNTWGDNPKWIEPTLVDTMAHEVLHAINHALFGEYYSEDFQNELTELEKQGKKLDNPKVLAMRNLEAIALTFAKKFGTNPQMVQLLNQMNELGGKNYHYHTLSAKENNGIPLMIKASANIMYCFDKIKLDNPSTYPEGWNKADVLEARKKSLDEFLAYSASDASFIERMNVFKDTVTDKNTKSFVQSVIDMFNNIKKAFYEFLGLNNKDYPESLATALMKEYFAIGQNEDFKFTNNLQYSLVPSFNSNAVTYWNNEQEQNKLSGNSTRLSVQYQMNLNQNRTNNHNDYLNELGKMFIQRSKDLLKTNDIALEYSEGIDVLDVLKDNSSPSFVSGLRSTGLSISAKEEEVAKLVSTGFKLTETLNPTLYSESLNIAEEVVSLLPALNLPKATEKALIKLPVNDLLALLATNKSLQTALGNLSDRKLTKTQKLVEMLENKLVFGNKLLNDNLQETIKQLGKQVLTFDTSNKLSESERIRKENEELQKEEQLLKAKEVFDEVTDKVGEPIHSIMKITSDVFSGQGLAQDGSDANSTIGSLIRQIIRNHEILKGRPTLASKLASWFLGLDFQGGYVADLIGQRAFQTEAIRERMISATSASIRKQFTDGLSDEQEATIGNVVMKVKLNNLQVNSKQLTSILSDTQARKQYIKTVQDKVRHSLVDLGLYQTQIDEAFNVYNWQLQGLAEIDQTGYAKGNADSSLILPNINSILGSNMTKSLLGNKEPNKDLIASMKELYTLYSLNHHTEEDLNILADLNKTQAKGFKSLMGAVDTYDSEVNLTDTAFYGRENFEMYKSNPNHDIVIIPVSDKESYTRYTKLGYEEKLTLDNGNFIVLHTNMSVSNRFTTGVLGLTDETINGENLLTGKSLNEVSSTKKVSGLDKQFKQAMQKAKKDSNYYSSLTTSSIGRLKVNETGSLAENVTVEVPLSIKKDLTDIYDEGINAIANYHGRMMEEYATQQGNENTIKQLVSVYENSQKKTDFIKFDGNFKPKSNSKADIEFANRINGIYRSLPTATKLYISQLANGLYLEMNHINNLLGYHQASVTDLFTGKSGLPESVQKALRGMWNLFATVGGFNPVKSAKLVEQAFKEVASTSKDFILNRSGVVALGNLTSNFIHLWNTGVPVNKITPYMAEGLKEVKEYSKTLNKSFEIDYLRKNPKLSKVEKERLDKQFELLTTKLNKSPVAYMVQKGVLTSVESIELKLQDNPDFSMIKRLQDKTGFSKFKQTSVGKVWANVMVQEGSKTHDFMNQTLDYGDFVAKYALFKHLTQNRQFSNERALRVIQDEFINYQLNRGREFDWLNATGLTWFLSYKLGIQKIIMRNLRRNFLRSVAVYEGVGSVTNQVVPRQNLLFDGSLDYQLSPSNLYLGFESHWLMQATKLF